MFKNNGSRIGSLAVVAGLPTVTTAWGTYRLPSNKVAEPANSLRKNIDADYGSVKVHHAKPKDPAEPEGRITIADGRNNVLQAASLLED